MTSAQRVAVTGSSGLIGGALSRLLRGQGVDVLHLVRRTPCAANEVEWDPSSHHLDPASLSGVSAVVHLAGAGVGDHRWTDAYKQTILSSRVDGTSTLAAALADLGESTRLVSGSAIGLYGDRGEEQLDEGSASGSGFLADVVRRWEACTAQASDAGCPTATVRTGLVLSPTGGALGRMLPLAKAGLAGPLGSGRQWWSWISLLDEVRALAHLVEHPEVVGPVNLVAPEPERQKEVARALGERLRRPAVLPAPSFALKIALGEFSADVLGSQRVVPTVLADSGFAWEHPDLGSALDWALSDDARELADS